MAGMTGRVVARSDDKVVHAHQADREKRDHSQASTQARDAAHPLIVTRLPL